MVEKARYPGNSSAAGGPCDAIKCTAWLDDTRDFWTSSHVHAEFFPRDKPAALTTQATRMEAARTSPEAITACPPA